MSSAQANAISWGHFDNLMKDDVLPHMEDLVFKKSKAFGWFKSNLKERNYNLTKAFKIRMKLAGPAGARAMPSNVFPEGSSYRHDEMGGKLRRFAGTLKVEGDATVFQKVQTDMGSDDFIDLISDGMQSVVDSMGNLFDWQLLGDETHASSQFLELPNDASPTAVVEAKVSLPEAIEGNVEYDLVDLVTGEVYARNLLVKDAEADQNVVVFDSSVDLRNKGITTTTGMIASGVYDTALGRSWKAAITGIDAHINAVNPRCGEIQGKDRTLEYYLQSKVMHNSGVHRKFSQSSFHAMVRAIKRRNKDTPPEVILVSPGVFAAIQAELRVTGDVKADWITKGTFGNVEGLTFIFDGTRIPIIPFGPVRMNCAYFLVPSTFFIELGPNEWWRTPGGSIWYRGEELAMSANYLQYMQLACTNYKANGVICDLLDYYNPADLAELAALYGAL